MTMIMLGERQALNLADREREGRRTSYALFLNYVNVLSIQTVKLIAFLKILHGKS